MRDGDARGHEVEKKSGRVRRKGREEEKSESGLMYEGACTNDGAEFKRE